MAYVESQIVNILKNLKYCQATLRGALNWKEAGRPQSKQASNSRQTSESMSLEELRRHEPHRKLKSKFYART
jgi:hypothetical protein